MTERGPDSGPDWGQVYRDHVAAVTALVRSLAPDEVTTIVPATPSWTVHEVLAHLAGGPADAITGRLDGAPGPEWTTRHVAERLGVPAEDLLAELASHEETVATASSGSPRPVLVFDIAVHHADLCEALGRGIPPERLWAPVLEAMVATRLGPAGIDAGTVPAYELFRGLFSRRSREQMRAWGLPLTDEQLDGLCLFGPRVDDQPIPS